MKKAQVLLNEKAVTQVTGLQYANIKYHRRADNITAVKIGTSWYYEINDINNLLLNNTTKNTVLKVEQIQV